ncbi:hypothetical protein U0070_011028 [Myodes glareolus]|uniref:Uncharacterized protein n=1 Tax=Myodes glareolus TaxID=447135 RepID=A0AAW0II40_MYOGA
MQGDGVPVTGVLGGTHSTWTRQQHTCGSRRGEGNKRPAEDNGNEKATKNLAWRGLSYRHDFLSPTKGSKQTKEAVPGLLKSDKKLPAGDNKSRRKPGAAASHTMSPVTACFHHRHESAPSTTSFMLEDTVVGDKPGLVEPGTKLVRSQQLSIQQSDPSFQKGYQNLLHLGWNLKLLAT